MAPGITQEQKDRIISEAQQYGGVDSEAFKNKVNTQYGAGAYNTLVNKAAQGVTTGQITGDITKANQELGTNISQEQVNLTKQTGTLKPEETKIMSSGGVIPGQNIVTPEIIKTPEVKSTTITETKNPEILAQKTEVPKPTNLGSIKGKNIISEAPEFKGADGQSYKTVRFDDGSLGMVKIGEGGVNELIGNTYNDNQRTDIKQIVEQGLNNSENIYKQLSINGNIPDSVKNTKPYVNAKARYDIANKYINYTEDQLYNAYINGEISQTLEKDLAGNPYITAAKEKYNKKLVTDNINNDAINSLNIYNESNGGKTIKKTEKTALDTLNEKFLNLFENMGKSENEIISFKDYMGKNYPDLVSQTQELNAKNKRLKELADERDARLKNIINENPGISINRANMLASRQNKDINEEIKSMSYEVSNLASNIQYMTNLADKEYEFELKQEERKDNLAKEQRGYAFNMLQDQIGYQRTLEERKYNETQAQKELEQKYNYTYGDINSTNPQVQNIAIENAVKSMYEKYPLPGMESQSIKVQKIKDKIAQGMTGTQAIQEVENEIRNSNRYKQYLASESAKLQPETKYSFTEMGGNLYRTDSKGNIALAVTGPKKYTKLDDGTYQDEQGNIVTKDDIKQNKLLNNSYLTASSGTNVGVECGQFARTAVGLTSTPGGNSLQERIKQFSDQTPVPGGLVLFNGGGYDKKYGHIAVVTGINNDGTINIKESNLNGDKKVTERTISANDANISGYYNNTPLTGGEGVSGNKKYSDAQLGLMSTIDNLTPTTIAALNDANLTAEDYGLFKNGGLPPTTSQVSGAKTMVDKINTLLKHSNLSDAVGPLDVKTPTLYGKTNDFVNKYNAFISNLAKDNLGVLKGPMSDKDVQFIKEMSTELNLNTDEQTFKDNLEKLKAQYEKIANGQSLNDAKSGNNNTGNNNTGMSIKPGSGGRWQNQLSQGRWQSSEK